MKLKLAHLPTSFLLDATKPGTKIFRTSEGDFKIRKNGKRILVIDQGKENEETVRVTPINKNALACG